MCWSGLAIDWDCQDPCQPSVQGDPNVFFFLIFPLVFVFLCVVVYEATRAWRPVACMFAQLEGKPQTSRASKQTVAQSSELTLFSSSNSPRSPNLTFPSSLHRQLIRWPHFFPQKIFHFWAARRSSLPSLDRLRPGTELIHTHRRKGSGAGTPSIIRSVATAHARP